MPPPDKGLEQQQPVAIDTAHWSRRDEPIQCAQSSRFDALTEIHQYLMIDRFLSAPVVAALWLLHLLPLAWLSVLGRGLGTLLHLFGRKRRLIVEKNLGLCFPELSACERAQLTREHFRYLGRSLLERSLLWWSSRERLARLIQVNGETKARALLDAGQPVILLVPHFVGLDAGGTAIAMRFDTVNIYAEQSSPTFDRLVLTGRRRFGDQLLLSRKEGARTTVKAMKAGRPFHYSPDTNMRRREAIFVPFFGIPAATTAGLSRLAKAAGAVVLPCITRMLPAGQGYVVDIGDPWPDFPTADVGADTRRMNAWIESVIRTMPEQYYWVHRRFKTRPLGEPKLY